MDTSGVQLDREHPTGADAVELAGGEPSYEILPDRAYDHVDEDELPAVPSGAPLCHGTLALRGPTSRAALEGLVRAARPLRLVDVNLRDPWWSREGVLAALAGATVVKLNEAELGRLVDSAPGAPIEPAARGLLERCGAERVVVTRGARGAEVLDRELGHLAGAPAGAARVVDTVGAGDAFTALLMLGECLGWDLATTLQRGLEFAEAIVTTRGATTDDRELYRPFLRRWTPQ
jgi:fructokinase